jgi:hypothetical protein
LERENIRKYYTKAVTESYLLPLKQVLLNLIMPASWRWIPAPVITLLSGMYSPMAQPETISLRLICLIPHQHQTMKMYEERIITNNKSIYKT